MTKMDLEDVETQTVCRSCLSSNIFKDGYKIKYKKSTYEQIFQICTGIQAVSDILYPKNFCDDCMELLKSFQDFKLKALTCHTNLVVKLDKSKGSLETENILEKEITEEQNIVQTDENGDIFEELDSNEKEDPPPSSIEVLMIDDVKYEDENDKHNKDDDADNDMDDDRGDDESSEEDEDEDKIDIDEKKIDYDDPDFTIPDVLLEEKSQSRRTRNLRSRNREKLEENEENDVEEHNTKLSWECPICNIVLHTAKDIKTHKYREKKKRLQVYECPYCKKKYERYQLKNHIKMHTDGKPYICEVCGKRLSSNIHLRKHMMIHFGKKFKCEQCGQGFTENYLLKDHMNVHENKTPHLCIRCGKAFATLTAWHQHNKRSKCKTISENPELLTEKPKRKKAARPKPKPDKESEEGKEKPKSPAKRFICSECGKVLKGKNNYEIHMALHQDKATYQYQCYVCGKKFGHKVALKNHLWVHNLSYRCGNCLKIFVSTQIKTHECIPAEGGHNDFLPNECRICRQILSSEIYMDKHLNTHKERKCSYCGETFTDAKKLMYHMNSHKLKCDLCGRGFAKNKSLREHINKQICIRGLSRKERIKKKT